MLSFVLASVMLGQWGAGSCAGPAHFTPHVAFTSTMVAVQPGLQPSASFYEWHTHPKDTNRWRYLYQNGVQIGGYDVIDGYWLPYKNGVWGKTCQAPWMDEKASEKLKAAASQLPVKKANPPQAPVKNQQVYEDIPLTDPRNQGVEYKRIEKLPEGETKYTRKGDPTGREETLKELGKPLIEGDRNLTDDRDKGWVIVFDANPQVREQVKKDFETHPALAPFKNLYLVQTYDPTNQANIQIVGEFYKGKTSGLIVQDPAEPGQKMSKARINWNDYKGPERLASELAYIQAIRKPNPNFDPNKVPDTAKPTVQQFMEPKYLIFGALGLLLWFAVTPNTNRDEE